MKFDILTLFPGMFEGPLSESIVRRGIESGAIDVRCHNIRNYAGGKHRVTDDAPFGGGPGMVMKVEPIAACIEEVRRDRPQSKIVLTSPQGRTLNHGLARELAECPGLIIICGRYEGVDERVKELFVDIEISLGDFVLTGGEIAAMAIVDSVSRFVPGVLGCGASAEDDTFADGLLEYPQFTRPPEFRGLMVPEVLLSGNHKEIGIWRRRESLKRTLRCRPDLLPFAHLTDEDERFLQALRDGAAQ